MTINEDVIVNVSDLLKKDTLLDQLDESEAFALGVNFKLIKEYPGFMDKFGTELANTLISIRVMSAKMDEIKDSMSDNSTLIEFIEKCINTYESKEDRVIVAFALGIYVEDMYAKSLKDE